MSHSPERFGYYDAAQARDFVADQMNERGWGSRRPVAGLTLGSGLGSFIADQMKPDALELAFADVFDAINRYTTNATPIPVHRRPGVAGHAHKLVIGELKNSDHLVIAQSGREHPYEGVETRRATFWLRVMQLLETPLWVGSNAAGIVTPKTLVPPALMAVNGDFDLNERDSSLFGPNDDKLGPRFPHASVQYTPENIALLHQVADQLGIGLQEGIYIRKTGPSYESPEEVYRLRAMLEDVWRQGAQQPGETRFSGDPVGVVGMSTTYEVDVTRHARQSKGHPAFGKTPFLKTACL